MQAHLKKPKIAPPRKKHSQRVAQSHRASEHVNPGFRELQSAAKDDIAKLRQSCNFSKTTSLDTEREARESLLTSQNAEKSKAKQSVAKQCKAKQCEAKYFSECNNAEQSIA